MVKRLSEQEKKVLVKCFTQGKTVIALAGEYDCTKTTIIRNLKNNLGVEKYKELIKQNKIINKSKSFKNENKNELDKVNQDKFKGSNINLEEELSPFTLFTEIIPLNCEIENSVQKDLSSVPISEMNFPKVVYMIVDNKIELKTKYLKEYPEWHFLSQEELNRQTIEIYFDIKIAKSFCNKEQKVIKVPNPDVFKIASSILLDKGISRIISADKLIAL